MNKNKLLVIAAHPDDEILGCGGTIAKLKSENEIHVIFMTNGVSSRGKNKKKETADMYIYRLAEKKSLKIGNVTRVLKETAVDCILNISQTNFSFSNMEGLKIEQNIHTGNTITLDVGDKPYSSMCDYQESCEYKCKNIFKGEIKELESVKDIDYSTYNEEFISSKTDFHFLLGYEKFELVKGPIKRKFNLLFLLGDGMI